MAPAASRAAGHGPRGFSLASIRMASRETFFTCAFASMGSVTIRKASAADAAADKLRNERRDVEVSITFTSWSQAWFRLCFAQSYLETYATVAPNPPAGIE